MCSIPEVSVTHVGLRVRTPSRLFNSKMCVKFFLYPENWIYQYFNIINVVAIFKHPKNWAMKWCYGKGLQRHFCFWFPICFIRYAVCVLGFTADFRIQVCPNLLTGGSPSAEARGSKHQKWCVPTRQGKHVWLLSMLLGEIFSCRFHLRISVTSVDIAMFPKCFPIQWERAEICWNMEPSLKNQPKSLFLKDDSDY